MRNKITIGSKIGYLRPETGRYDWAEVIGFTDTGLKMQQRKGRWVNQFEEKTEDVIKYLKTPSPDFKDGRPLLKFKGNNKLY